MASKKVEAQCCAWKDAPIELPEDVASQISRQGGLRSLIKRLPSGSAINEVARRHQALSDPVRLRILWALGMADLCPCVLKRIVGLSDSKLSYHLDVLERTGLVSSRRTKNWMIYSLTSLGAKVLNERDYRAGRR